MRILLGIFVVLAVCACDHRSRSRNAGGAPALTLDAPQGGDMVGDSFLVRWTTDGSPGTVEIALSSDSGASYTVLAAATEDDGSFEVDTSEMAEGDGYRIRITPHSMSQQPGEPQVSTADFGLDRTPPVVELRSPLGGESWNGTRTVQWQTTDLHVDQVDIRLSADSGASFDTTAAEGIEDDGSFSLVTDALAESTGYRVRVVARDAAGNESDPADSADFVISHGPSLTGALFLDADDDGEIDEGDQIQLAFSAQVAIDGADGSAFDLAVTDDSLGTDPSVSLDGNGGLRITLGANPSLKARGIFADDTLDANSPSAIDISALLGDGVIENAVTGHDAVPGSRDLVAGFEEAAALGTGASSHLLLEDLDGDADLDLVRGVANTTVEIWRNDGSGTFVKAAGELSGTGIQAIVLGDFDRDGDPDLVIAESEASGSLWWNDGSGAFSDSGQSLDSGASRAVLQADLDGDGDLDLAFGNDGTANTVWTNAGGSFTNSSQQLGSASTRALVAADVDRDGDLDLFAANDGSASRLWLNDGSGSFSDSGQSFSARSARAAVAADFDRDGWMDILVAHASHAPDLLRNDGAGNLVEEVASDELSAVAGLAAADLDVNGAIDVVLAGPSAAPTVLWNDGAGVFPTSLELGDDPRAVVAAGDVDADGDHDLVQSVPEGGFSLSRSSLGAAWGSATFSDSGQSLTTGTSFGNAVADLDGDGDLDAYFESLGDSGRVYLNDGNGQLSAGSTLSAESAYISVLFDCDADGDLDVLRVNHGSSSTVWVNDGSATFSLHDTLADRQGVGGAAGDFDGDGDLDIVQANFSGQADEVWLNDGNGDFSDSGQTLGSLSSLTVEIADLDRDGDLDLLSSADFLASNTPYFNDGSGTFSAGAGISTSETNWGTPLGDLDGDGDVDVAVSSVSGDLEIWLNDGTGSFSDSGQSLSAAGAYGACLGDIDGDGDLDVLLSNRFGAAELYLNDGEGTFSGPISLTGPNSLALSLGDLDGDGDLDLVASGFSEGSVRINR